MQAKRSTCGKPGRQGRQAVKGAGLGCQTSNQACHAGPGRLYTGYGTASHKVPSRGRQDFPQKCTGDCFTNPIMLCGMWYEVCGMFKVLDAQNVEYVKSTLFIMSGTGRPKDYFCRARSTETQKALYLYCLKALGARSTIFVKRNARRRKKHSICIA